MRREVQIRERKQTIENYIGVDEAMNRLGCQLSDECATKCDRVQNFIKREMPVNAIDIFQDKSEAISVCEGPVQKSFGRVACGANLPK